MPLKSILIAAALFWAAACAENKNIFVVDSLEGETWWGLSNTDGNLQPFADYASMDLANDSRLGETAPFLVSSKGRYIWCDSPFVISCKEGKFTLKS